MVDSEFNNNLVIQLNVGQSKVMACDISLSELLPSKVHIPLSLKADDSLN